MLTPHLVNSSPVFKAAYPNLGLPAASLTRTAREESTVKTLQVSSKEVVFQESCNEEVILQENKVPGWEMGSQSTWS